MEIPCLPENIREALARLPEEQKRGMEEIRFRRDQPVKLVFPEGERLLCYRGRGISVTDKLLRDVYNRATEYSPYAMKAEERGLFYPLPGGLRMGICGDAVIRDGEFRGISHISSLVIRVAKQHIGIADPFCRILMKQQPLPSCLILSPPGCGKTSFLRDLIRCISQKGIRVAVADERRELSAMSQGKAALDLGPSTDVLCGLTKTEAIPLLLRVMNPQVIAVDELTGKETEGILEASASGVSVLATVHGRNIEDLKKRSQFAPLLDSNLFQYCVVIGQDHHFTIERLDRYAEDVWCGTGCHGSHDCRLIRRAGAQAGCIPDAAFVSCAGVDGK